MFTLKNEPQDFKHILEQSFTLYAHIFRISLPYTLCATLLMFIPHTLSTMHMLSKGLLSHHHFALWSMLICWLGGFTFLCALIFRIYCYCYQIPSRFVGSIQHALFKLVSVLLLSALYCLIVLSGTMLLIIPGIILMITLMFSFILVITDNQNVLQTLTISHRLVWGHWWHVVAVMSVPFVLNLSITLCIMLGIIILLTQQGLTITEITFALSAANIFIQIIFIPLIFSVALVLLHDLRHRTVQEPRW
jgi:hypothetical protein